MDAENDLLSASLESINSGKRVEKFQRFFSKFQRECEVSLSNAQEWIKAELPIVSGSIDLTMLKEELKSSKTSERRKHLLSALIFEHATREATQKHNAATAAMMAMHMLNHIWYAKYELYEPQAASTQTSQTTIKEKKKKKAPKLSKEDLKKEQILTSLIERGEKRISDSQIQKQNESSIQPNPMQITSKTTSSQKNNSIKKVEQELWKEAKFVDNKDNISITQMSRRKTKKKGRGMLSKVREKLPLKMGAKTNKIPKLKNQISSSPEQNPEDCLLDDPNNSAIMVSQGLAESIDDSLIQERPDFSDDPNASGITVRKVLKRREHETQDPGSNTIVMKLASKSGKKNNTNLSIPEKCQQAVNELCHQFPGYDIVAIRNMAAQKVGVSLQYIENLNILPEI